MRPSVERSYSLSHMFSFVNTFFKIFSTFFKTFFTFPKMLHIKSDVDSLAYQISHSEPFLTRFSFSFLESFLFFGDFFIKIFKNSQKNFYNLFQIFLFLIPIKRGNTERKALHPSANASVTDRFPPPKYP